MTEVNRYLRDKHFDHIDHALGRPVDPLKKTARNYFAIDPDAPLADEFRQSEHWDEGKTFCGTMAFHVTAAGRQALKEHLHQIGDPHRAFEVTYEGDAMRVVERSHSKAKYLAYLRISDCCDLTFGEFCKTARVRLAA